VKENNVQVYEEPKENGTMLETMCESTGDPAVGLGPPRGLAPGQAEYDRRTAGACPGQSYLPGH
jgi:hypothetical protein